MSNLISFCPANIPEKNLICDPPKGLNRKDLIKRKQEIYMHAYMNICSN